MSKRTRRPAQFREGHMKDRRGELLERANLSRTRLASSELGASGQAWKLWAVCIAETVDFARAGTQTYAATLAHAARIDRTGTGHLLRRFSELGVVEWKPAPRASKAISDLTLPLLPRDVTPQPARHAPDVTREPAHSSTEVIGIELITQQSPSGAGAPHQHTPLTTAPDGVEGAEGWHASEARHAEARPEPGGYDWDAYDAEVEAAWQAAQPGTDPALARTLARFGEAPPGSFHGDERTGDTTGDDEAAQLRWASANPSKTRARRRRG